MTDPTAPGVAGGAGAAAPVAVVIVAWNSAEFIGGCLSSLARLRRPPAEVVVVDNGSLDDSVERARRGFPGAVVVECGENLGFCHASNLGISRTSSPFVLTLNPDARVADDFLERLLPAFDDPAVGIASGKLYRPDGRTLDSAGQLLGRSRQPVDRGYGLPDRGLFDRDEEVFGACGAAALYRRAALEAVADPGGEVFDERFFAFFEDLDVAWRARRAGWKAVYRHRAVGYHARGATAADPRVRGRWSAMRRRPAAIRFHVAKNRYLTILRNDTPAAYLRDLPFIAARDLGTLALLASSSPGVLVKLWRERALFRGALERRRLDSVRRRNQTLPGGGAAAPGGPA